MRDITPTQVVQKLLSSSFCQVKSDGKTNTVETRRLAVLLLESLCTFRENPGAFGTETRSFNAALKHSLEDYVLAGTPQQRAARLARLDDIITAYNAPLGPRGKLSRTRIGDITLPDYFREKAAAIFPRAVADMKKERIGSKPLIPDGISIPEPGLTEQWLCRRLHGRLLSIYCVELSEQIADELYLMTGEMLVDSTGTWDRKTHPPSEVFRSPDNEQRVTLPTNPYWLHDWRILNPPDTYSVSPLIALCDVTLMEQDYSDKERVYAAFRAAYKSVALLASIGGAGPVGIAIALVGILFNLLVALDGDDHLGNASFRFDDILSDELDEYVEIELPISSPHGESDCGYLIKIQNRTTDQECPTDPPFRIEGPTTRTIAHEVPTRGGYRLVAPLPLNEDSIRWSVSAAGATINQNGKRYTSVTFSRGGNFTIEIEANQVNGENMAAALGVSVTESDGSYL